MNQGFDISIIIPVINEEKNLQKLLPFLNKYGGEHLREIIVVDGGSTDNSIDIAKANGAINVISPKGRAIQMNNGAEIAGGSFLYFVHADTRPPESFADDILHYSAEGYDFGCYRFRFDTDIWYYKINNYFTRFNRLWCRGGDQTLYVKAELFRALNGFDESFVIMEEYNFLERAMKNHELKIMPKDVLVSARKYQENGYFRVQWANYIAFKSYKKGIPTEEIKRNYYEMLRMKTYQG